MWRQRCDPRPALSSIGVSRNPIGGAAGQGTVRLDTVPSMTVRSPIAGVRGSHHEGRGGGWETRFQGGSEAQLGRGAGAPGSANALIGWDFEMQLRFDIAMAQCIHFHREDVTGVKAYLEKRLKTAAFVTFNTSF